MSKRNNSKDGVFPSSTDEMKVVYEEHSEYGPYLSLSLSRIFSFRRESLSPPPPRLFCHHPLLQLPSSPSLSLPILFFLFLSISPNRSATATSWWRQWLPMAVLVFMDFSCCLPLPFLGASTAACIRGVRSSDEVGSDMVLESFVLSFSPLFFPTPYPCRVSSLHSC